MTKARKNCTGKGRSAKNVIGSRPANVGEMLSQTANIVRGPTCSINLMAVKDGKDQ
jgi:hypothetical protein